MDTNPNPFGDKYVWDCLKPENSDRVNYLDNLVKPYLNEHEVVFNLDCGFSPLASIFLKHNNKFIGVDKSDEAIKYCKEIYKGGEFYVCDDSSLPLIGSIDVFLHLGITSGMDPWGLESRTEVQSGTNVIIRNLPRLIVLEAWMQDCRHYIEYKSFIEKMAIYDLRTEITYEIEIKRESINPSASDAAKRIACIFILRRDLCSLSDHNISKIFLILHPSSHAESIADLNLGFGFAYYAFARILRPKLVVVLGSMIGFSAVCFALGVKDNANSGRVILVDAGYSDSSDGKAKGMGGAGFWKNAEKHRSIFKTFGVDDTIEVKLMRTSEYAEIYEKLKMPPIDLLMIDADHSFEGFKFDFEKFGDFVRDDGLIIYHDALVEFGWQGYPFGIKKYVDEVIEKSDKYANLLLNIWPGLGILQKSIRKKEFMNSMDTLKQELNEKDQSISEIQQEIAEMKRSVIYQMTMKFHNGVIEQFLPQGTGRRKLFDQGLERIRVLVN
jgi:predicted O-methyltransferase YrrM